MDQDSFRQLLQTPRPGGSSTLRGTTNSRGFFVTAPPIKKTVDASQPAFKPRKVKKTQESKYRDRASERRVGDGNDYAHIEAVLEDFEKRSAGNEDKAKVEAQRKYLGGDSDHSILVKGLDFALLEQKKARSTLTGEDIDALDQAYLESSSHHESIVPKKRTREDLIRELKEQRAGKPGHASGVTKDGAEEARQLEEAKQKGKFKPIGFKPIGESSDTKKKSKSDATDREKKKKKRKPNEEDRFVDKTPITPTSSMLPPPIPKPVSTTPAELIDDNFDIFADAGEYEGIDIGDDDDDMATSHKANEDGELVEEEQPSTLSVPRRWIDSDEPLSVTQQKIPLSSIPTRSSSFGASLPQERVVSDEEAGLDHPARLTPFASSALPSIKDFLAMDKAAGSYDKKKKRKDKKKGGGGDDDDDNDDDAKKKKTIEAKVDRDYKRLKSFTDKKAAGSR